jgi:hypothetical protein
MRSGRTIPLALVLSLVTGVSVGASVARGDSTTTIGFEDLDDGTAVGAQYSGLGIQLAQPADLSVQSNVLAHNGSKVLLATDHACAPGSSVGFTILLSSPRTTVGLWVRDPFPGDPTSHTATLHGFQADGSEAGMTNLSVAGAGGWNQLLMVADPGTTIDHATVSVETGICTMLFDDLSIDAATNAQPPSVALQDLPAQTVSVERGGTTTTAATLRRSNGSTGRVNLTVTGMPSGVSAVLSPTQANGSTLSGPVSVTLSATAGAPVTSPATVTLHATPVDATAGTVAATGTFAVAVAPPSVSIAVTGTPPTDLYRSDSLTIGAQLVRHSLSSGTVSLAVSGPPGVTVTVTPTTVAGAAPITPLSVSVSVAADAARVPDGAITVTATSTDPAAAPPGQPAKLVLATPVRVPELVMAPLLPKSLVLRAGAGYSRVDAHITAIDLPPNALVTTTTRGLPGDVQVEASPASFPASDGTGLYYVKLTAQTGLTAASAGYPSFTATAAIPGHGTVSDFQFLKLVVVPTIRYGLVARGIEVTQGTQTLGTDVCSTIPTRDFLHIESSVPYTGVRLVDGDLTVARVYVSAFFLTNIKALPGVDVRLHAFRAGKEIAGGPLSPSAAPAAVKLGESGCVTVADRTSSDNIYTFVLPPAWTYGTVTLQAEILPLTPNINGQLLDECGSHFCQVLKRFTLRNIAFNRIRWPGIKPLRITANGVVPVGADAATYQARMLDPGDPGLWSYQGDIDVSAYIALADAVAKNPFFASLSRRDIIEGGALNDVQTWGTYLSGGRSIVMGIAPQLDSVYGVTRGHISSIPTHSGLETVPAMIVSTTRPLTSVAHELGHMIGRPHAGQNCPGTKAGDKQAGEPWLPDDQGFLQGVGLDLWGIAPGGFKATASTPYLAMASGSADQFYDYMSYCVGSDEGHAWLSPRGWNDEVGYLEAWTHKTGGATGPAVRAATPVPVLTLSAIGRDDVGIILSTTPGKGVPAHPGAGAVLVGYNASGAEVSRAAAQDTVLEDSGLHSYTGVLASTGVSRVVLVSATGVVLATQTRSAHAPKVAITSPRAGVTIGGSHAVRVTWKATDADRDRLVETVEASADDGRTWRQVYRGAGHTVLLPAAYFTASSRARLRVTVNDGFRSTSVVSGRLHVLAAPATVHIDSPTPKATFRSDGSLTLVGSASTVLGPVPSSKLVWYLDGRQIAKGSHASVRNLPPGHRILTLRVAGDRGRGARVAVTIKAVTPPFLAVRVAASVSTNARFVTVHLRSGAAVTVTSGGKRVVLKAKGSAILRVPITPGHGEVVLTLTATLRRSTYVFTRAVARR